MGGSFSSWGLFGWKKQPDKILILGLDNSGKTCLLLQTGNGRINESHDQRRSCSSLGIEGGHATIGFNVASVTVGNDEYEAYDVGGSSVIMGFWKYYFLHKNAVVFVVCIVCF
jgi:GTPase SAR1 family protein